MAIQALTKIRFLQIKKYSIKYFKKQALPVLLGPQVRHLITKELSFNEFGEPIKVLKMRETNLPPLKGDDVLVRMLAAPVNPSDINTIQGKYPVKLSLPCVAGNEGVGVVEKVGCYVTALRPGNRVIITTPALGTWRCFAVFDQRSLRLVPNYLEVAEAASLAVNPCTAYRILTDFKPLRTCGGVVIQNGANSACGQNIIQLCKNWCLASINIVRNRPKIKELKDYLFSLGATYVFTEEELRTTNIFKDKCIAQPCLAINCVGGQSSLDMLRCLEPSGFMVTYGGMSKRPVTVPNNEFIFKDLGFYGFWMTAWNEMACESAKHQMLSELITLMVNKNLVAPVHKFVKFEKFDDILCTGLKGFQGHKFILDFR